MESIGSRLKKARAGRNISIEEAQKDTRIHRRILSSLENDKPEQAISGVIYVKSFIKKYADYLGLDGAAISEEYASANKDAEAIHRELHHEACLPPKRVLLPFKFPFKAVFTVLVVAATLFFGVRLVTMAASKIKTFPASRPKVVQKTAALKPRPVPKQTTRKESSRVVDEKPAKSLTSTSFQVPKDENLELKISVRGEVYLKIKADGSSVYDGILKKGASEVWNAKESLEISTNRAEAITAELNGAPLGVMGKGAVKNILIGREGVKSPGKQK